MLVYYVVLTCKIIYSVPLEMHLKKCSYFISSCGLNTCHVSVCTEQDAGTCSFRAVQWNT